MDIDSDRKSINVPVYHIVPKWDHLIIPTTSARYDDTPESHIYYYNGSDYGHCGIAYNDEVALIICEWCQH